MCHLDTLLSQPHFHEVDRGFQPCFDNLVHFVSAELIVWHRDTVADLKKNIFRSKKFNRLMISLLTENIILVSVRNIMAENETFFANSGVSLVPIMVLFIEKVMVRAGTKSNLYLQHLKTLSNFYLFYQCYRCPSLRCCLPWL